MTNPELQVVWSNKIKINKNSRVYLFSNVMWLPASEDWINDFNKTKNKPPYVVLYAKQDGRHFFKTYSYNDTGTMAKWPGSIGA